MNRPLVWIHKTGYAGPGGIGISALYALLRSGKTALTADDTFQGNAWSGRFVGEIRAKAHRQTDRSVLLGLTAAQDLLQDAMHLDLSNTGIAMGTSRGPTGLWEKYYEAFDKQHPVSPLTSPLTTPGILASAIAQHFRLDGNALTLSMTCSSSMLAILNGIAWLRSGLCSQYIAGGAEAPLTPFTIAQASALQLLSKYDVNGFPCLALAPDKIGNTMVLAEAAACILMLPPAADSNGVAITGFGAAIENIPSASGISANGDALKDAMQKALHMSPGVIDVICMHAPGTILGDQAEMAAISGIFGADSIPAVYPVKAFTGHTFGASGVMGVLAGIACLEEPLPMPAYLLGEGYTPVAKRVMVNAAGFGGQAVSLILEKE